MSNNWPRFMPSSYAHVEPRRGDFVSTPKALTAGSCSVRSGRDSAPVSAAAARRSGGAYVTRVARHGHQPGVPLRRMVGQPVPIPHARSSPTSRFTGGRSPRRSPAPSKLPALVANLPAAIDTDRPAILASARTTSRLWLLVGFAQLFAMTVGQGSPASLPGGPALRSFG